MLSEVLIERDQYEEADERVSAVELPPALERMIAGLGPGCGARRGPSPGRAVDEAERDARRARELVRARGWTAPLKSLAGLGWPRS